MAFNYEDTNANKSVKNILILGETGVGKSTWINGIANYFNFDCLDEVCKGEVKIPIPTCFYQFNQKMMIGKESKNENLHQVGQSATQKPKVYTLTKDSKPYINLIDTPGIGGFNITEKDIENFDKIMVHISSMKNLDAICLLLKPNTSRLTLTFRFCIQQLLVRLHTSVKKNILFCFTHSRCSMYGPGDTFPVLNEELAKMRVGIKAIYNDKNRNDDRNNCFCFDNEAFRYIVCVKNGKNVLPGIHETYVESWNQAKTETIALFKKIDILAPYNVANTISLTQAKNIIVALIEPMGECLRNIIENINATQEINEQIKTASFAVNYIENTSLCKEISLQSNNVNDSVYDSVYDCRWNYSTKIEKEIISENIQKPMIAKKSKLNQIEGLKIQTVKNVEELQKEKTIILKITAIFGAYLERNALIANNDVFDEYIKKMLKQEDKKVGFMNSLKNKSLKEVLSFYEKQKNDILNDITNSTKEEISAENINDLKDQLIHLKHMGKTFEKVLTNVIECFDKAQNKRRLRVIGNVDNVFNNIMNIDHNECNNARTKNISSENKAFQSLRSVMNVNTHALESQKTYVDTWNRARSESLTLFKILDFLVPYNFAFAFNVNEARKIAISLIRPIEECMIVINDNIRIGENFLVKNLEENIENAIKLKGILLSINCLDYPATVCTHKDCIECVSDDISEITNTSYKTICHKYCLIKDAQTQVTNIPKLSHCEAFSNGPKCKKCDHTYDVHMQITYTARKVVEEFVSEDAQKLIMDKKSKDEQIKEMKRQIRKKIEELREEKKNISEAAVKCGAYLVNIALIAYENVFGKFMNIMDMEDENSNLSNNLKLKQKSIIQQYFEKQKNVISYAIKKEFKKEILSAEDVINLKEQLTDLKHMGKTLKDILTSVMYCTEKMQNIRRKCDIRKSENNTNNSVNKIGKDHYDKRKVICFNIEAFEYLECVLDEKAFPLVIKKTHSDIWKQEKAKSFALFKVTDSTVPYNVNDAIRANQARKISIALLEPMKDCLSLISDNVKTVKKLSNDFQNSNCKFVNIENVVKLKIISLPTKSMIYPNTVCTHKECFDHPSVNKLNIINKSCKTICRNHCLFKDALTQVSINPIVKCSDAYESGQNCNVCGHTYDVHILITYIAKKIEEEFLSKDAQKQILNKKSYREQIIELEKQTLKKVRELEEEKKTISAVYNKVRNYLIKNALVAYNNVFGEYIKMMIKDKEEKPKLEISDIEKLKKALKYYEKQKKFILNAIVNGSNENYLSLGDINNLTDKLIYLEHKGKAFSNILENVMYGLEKINN